MDNPLAAAQVSRQGQLRLALLKGREQEKYLTKHLLRGSDLALKAAALGNRQELVQALIAASFQQALFSEVVVLRDQDSFQRCYQAGIGWVVDIAQQLSAHIESVLPSLHQNQKQIRALGLSAIYAKEDIDQQLNWLFSPETISRISLDRMEQYPRLVKGIGIRLEKLAVQVGKDQQYIQEIQSFLQPVPKPEEQLLSEELAEAIDSFHWMLQEYRISLFAQQLKTRVPVSAKRLQKQWLDIDNQLHRFLGNAD